MKSDDLKAGELKARPLERLLAEALRYGTWVASAAIAAGLMFPALQSLSGGGAGGAPATALIRSGIALFILLPVLRVVVMLIAFLRDRDYRMSAVAALVLGIIVLGCVMGTMSVSHA